MIGRLNRIRRKLAPSIPGLIALLIVLTGQLAGLPWLDRIGLQVFDSYQRMRPRPAEDAPVRIVDIDDETIRRLGQWPWPRDQLAELTRRLTAAGAAVIAYDIVFSEPDRTSPLLLAKRLGPGFDAQARATLARLPDPDVTFAGAVRNAPVVLGYFLTRDGDTPAIPPKAGIWLCQSNCT